MPYNIEIWVFNAAGEFVRQLFTGQSDLAPSAITLSSPVVVAGVPGGAVALKLGATLAGGFSQVAWDGTNDQGQIVASGQYYFQIKSRDSYSRVTSFVQPVAVVGVHGKDTVGVYNSAGELVVMLASSLPDGATVSGISLDQETFAPAFDPVTGAPLSFLTVSVLDGKGITHSFKWDGMTGQGRPAESGVYTVCGYSSEGQNSFMRNLTVLKSASAPGDPGARVAPNPTSADGKFQILYKPVLGFYGRASVYSLNGEVVLKSNDFSRGGAVYFDGGALAGGIYFVEFELMDGQAIYYSKRLKVAVLR
jgi:flagellar hook assembly protein FlgD